MAPTKKGFVFFILSSRQVDWQSSTKRNEPNLAKSHTTNYRFFKESCLILATKRNSLSKYGDFCNLFSPKNERPMYNSQFERCKNLTPSCISHLFLSPTHLNSRNSQWPSNLDFVLDLAPMVKNYYMVSKHQQCQGLLKMARLTHQKVSLLGGNILLLKCSQITHCVTKSVGGFSTSFL